MHEEGSVLPVSLDTLGQRYRRYRLADPDAEEAMAGSLRRWGQLAPVVACVREEKLEVLDGFKRLAAARQLAAWTSLSVRVLEVDEPAAKAAILGLNRGQRATRELEEAWIVQALVREDGLTQVEAGHLLAQELGRPAAGAAGTLERGGQRRPASGAGGPIVSAAVDTVARGQPGSALGPDAARDADDPGNERRDQSAGRGQRSAGGVRAGQAA